MNKTAALVEVADVRFGWYARPSPTGEAAYLQIKQFNEYGRQIFKPEDYVDLDANSSSHVLKDGDVLFVGKGTKLFSWCHRQTDHPVIASSVFFVLRPDLKTVYPEYLTAILNAPQSKTVFQQLGSGTNIFSIRKSELSAFQIPMLPIQQQKIIASLTNLHQREIELTQKLLEQKQSLYTAVISKLIK